jgi:phosphatidylethanolamine-binding protein (PEBP) family uncharacterized protein
MKRTETLPRKNAKSAFPFAATLLALGVCALLCADTAAQTPPPPGGMTLEQTISDGAQRTTLAFAGLGMVTGSLEAQSFFPPGKVADYTGFQYLRDNDLSNMGHNTSFLTRVANNVIYMLNDSQFAQLKTLATAQLAQIDQYGYKRFPLMKAFRRLLDGDIPSGSTGLNLNSVKEASRELYLLDGQISFDRALLYANIFSSFDATQKAYLDAMKGKGWSSWPDITNDQIKTRMQGLPQGTAVAVMTYASDLFSWYAGSVEADVYFCPERQGTYYGSFYIKDAPAIGHEGYSIDEQLTATAGSALCDSSKGYVTQAQATVISSLVETQRNNLYAGATSIVGVRTQIATLLRGLIFSTANSESVKSQVLALSGTYGDLDGENNYYYATVFAQVYATLSTAQKTKLAELRHSIMSGTYTDGTPFDFSVCTTPYLYSAAITNTSVLSPYISNTDYLFFEPVPGEGEGEPPVEGEGEPSGSMTLQSSEVVNGGALPAEYTCDGTASTLPLEWSGAPAEAQSYAIIMHHIAPDGTKWYWILYDIPANVLSLAKNATDIGTLGNNSVNGLAEYAPPCSQGPGEKTYTVTVYALSAAPQISVAPEQVSRDVLLAAVQGLTLDTGELNVVYSRPGEGEGEAPPEGEGEPGLNGTLTVTLQPAAAIAAGAQWTMDGGATWKSSGATLNDIVPGSVTVGFKPVSGWTTPASQTVSVNPGQTATVSAAYVAVLPNQFALTVTATGQGKVTLNPAGVSYAAGTVVTLTPNPTGGWHFDHWSGALTGSAAPASITMSANTAVTAVFTEDTATPQVAVPDVLGKSLVQAIVLLGEGGLTVGTVRELHVAAVPAGNIVYQDPVGGVEVAAGGAVDLVVSSGPESAEGETPTDVEPMRQEVAAAFDQADEDNSGGLSLEETTATVPGMTEALFTALDTDGDGQLTSDELGLDEEPGSGCTGLAGCTGGKKSFPGDLLLGLLGLTVLQVVSQKRP